VNCRRRLLREVATSIQGYNAYNASNSDYLRDQSQTQAQIRNEQNESVDKLSSGLSRVKELAVAIDAEVREQDEMLKDIDTEVDVAQNKMDSAISHIEKLLKTKDRCTLCTIFILVIAFVAVAITAFYVLTKT
jgi:syntaxin 6